MNKADWEAKQKEKALQRLKYFTDNEVTLTKDAPSCAILTAVLQAAFGNPELFIREQSDFKKMTQVMESCDLLGLPIENWTSADWPEKRNRDFTYKLPSGSDFAVYVYLSQDASCEIVEVDRKSQPDKIIYEMRCNDEA